MDAKTSPARAIDELDTPALVLDVARMERNVARLTQRLSALGVRFRPHVKTAKSVEVAMRLFPDGRGPITVSTLKEAEYFAAAGMTDITYAVGLPPAKIARLRSLVAHGVDVSVIIDSEEQARALAAARGDGAMPAVLLEIDCDGHRGGLTPADGRLLSIAGIVRDGGIELRGVLTHAGESYRCRGGIGLPEAAEAERAAAVAAA
ncbi:MAG TPA: alanine racemase, partial [Steroidobacteraceae bacterium]